MSWPFSRRTVATIFAARRMAAKRSMTEVARALPLEALDGVVGNEVHLGVQAPRVLGEDLGLLGRVVHALDEDVFERHHLALLLLVLGAGVEQLGEGILPVHRHDLLAHLVGRAVQRQREPDLQRLLRQLADLRGEAAGGNR